MLEERLTSASWPGELQCPLASMVPSSWYGGGYQPGFSTEGWRRAIVCVDSVPGEGFSSENVAEMTEAFPALLFRCL